MSDFNENNHPIEEYDPYHQPIDPNQEDDYFVDEVEDGKEDFEDAEPEGFSPGHKKLILLFLVVSISLALALLLQNSIFRIQSVRVVGNTLVPWEQVVLSAGISKSSNYYNINEKKIEESINKNRYLKFKRLEKQYPNRLTLYVEERVPAACIKYIGIAYIIAEDGMILDKTKDLALVSYLPLISGLHILSIYPGSIPACGRVEQMPVCIQLLDELKKQGVLNEVEEINVAEPKGIYMITKDGFSVRIGNGDYLRAKIGTARAVLAELRKNNYSIGSIVITKPGEAMYRPDNQSNKQTGH